MAKVTYRDRFISVLQLRVESVAEGGLFQTKEVKRPEFDIAALVRRVETETNTRLTAKSPKHLYMKFGNAMRRSVAGFGDARIETVIARCIEAARLDAGGRTFQIKKRAYLLGQDFVRIVDSLKGHIDTASRQDMDNNAMINLYFTAGGSAGYASDGHRIVRAAIRCAVEGGAFSAYIKAPRVRPRNFDLVTIELDGHTTVVSFGENTFRYEVRPETVKHNMKALFEAQEREFTPKYQVVLSIDYLQQAAASLSAMKGEGHVHISISDNGGPLRLVCGSTEAFLMTVGQKDAVMEGI